MKAKSREIVIGLIAVGAVLIAVWYFFGKVTERKAAEEIDLYTLIAPSSQGVLVINRPETFSRFLASQSRTRDLFATVLPDIYLTLLQKNPDLTQIVISFHPQGAIMYAKADERQTYRINKEILTPTFNAYSPQQHMLNGISFTYFPVADHRFFGYYQYRGIWAGSFSKRLLEGTAGKQLVAGRKTRDLAALLHSLDTNAPVTVFLPVDSLNLYVALTDSTEWKIRDRWWCADLYLQEGKLCGIGAHPYEAARDTLYASIADTLARRLETFFPTHRFKAQADPDSISVYFTVCDY